MKTLWIPSLIPTKISDVELFFIFYSFIHSFIEWVLNSTIKVTLNSQPRRCTFARHQLQFLHYFVRKIAETFCLNIKVKFEFLFVLTYCSLQKTSEFISYSQLHSLNAIQEFVFLNWLRNFGTDCAADADADSLIKQRLQRRRTVQKSEGAVVM